MTLEDTRYSHQALEYAKANRGRLIASHPTQDALVSRSPTSRPGAHTRAGLRWRITAVDSRDARGISASPRRRPGARHFRQRAAHAIANAEAGGDTARLSSPSLMATVVGRRVAAGVAMIPPRLFRSKRSRAFWLFAALAYAAGVASPLRLFARDDARQRRRRSRRNERPGRRARVGASPLRRGFARPRRAVWRRPCAAVRTARSRAIRPRGTEAQRPV